MTSRRLPKLLRLTLLRITAFSFLFAALAPAMRAQMLLASAPLPDAPTPSVEATPPAAVMPIVIASPIAHPEHKFFNTQNRVLIIASAALNGADFAVTRANLQSGGEELNPLVRVFGRSTAGLAVNFAGETASVIGLGYFFHKTGHHKLERATFLVNIGSSAGAVTYGLTHR
ncbi:MAG: hypothetical protein ABSG72_04715 [Candidatus Sulfotelmatobacter sp.]|jgi:hypothetical protein